MQTTTEGQINTTTIGTAAQRVATQVCEAQDGIRARIAAMDALRTAKIAGRPR